MKHHPTLYIFSGLPGVGKTTLARRLAQHVRATCLRIDTIEQALRDLCNIAVEGEGYRLAYRVAADNLQLGVDVIADSCNPIELTRNEWEAVAEDAEASFVNIEVQCSSMLEHRERVESRNALANDEYLPTWREVETREYHAWEKDRLVIDTAGVSVDRSFDELRSKLGV